MLTEERKEYILRQVNENEIVKSQDLIMALNVSESTIRRDLQELEEANLVKRIHGGCKKIHKLDYELSMTEKSSKNIREKQLIAQMAAQLIADNDVIYLDAGTTTFEMIPFIPTIHVTVVTNSIYHANALADRNIPVIILGGAIKNNTKASVSNFASQQLASLVMNKAFLGINGIHSKFGYTTPDPDEAYIKTLAISQSQKTYILADISKFGETSFAHVAPIKKATILTNELTTDLREKMSLLTTIKEATK